jgi:ribonuclease HI
MENKLGYNPNVLAASVNAHIDSNYANHLKIYTDGSVLDNEQAGAAFVIPHFKIEKSYSIGKHISIFSAELVAILMALNYIISIPFNIFQFLFCVDSKSVLYAIRSFNTKVRGEIIIEINTLIHYLRLRGSVVQFCWVPSHCGISSNELVDRAAKKGAQKRDNSISLQIPLSLQERYHLLERASWKKFTHDYSSAAHYSNLRSIDTKSLMFLIPYKNISGFQLRNILCMINRFRLNAFKTKFSSKVECVCGENFKLEHILFQCKVLKSFLPATFISHGYSLNDLGIVLSDPVIVTDLVLGLLHSPVSALI